MSNYSKKLYRDFNASGHPVFGLYGGDKNGHCACGSPDCKAAYKHPLTSRWQHTPIWDDEQLDTMELSGQVATGYGVLCKGLLVIDVDARNGGVASFERLRNDVPEVGKAGLIVNTGSGGGSKHLYFSVTLGTELQAHHEDYPGIDFRSGKAFVVGPGSLHASGNSYEATYGSVEDIEPAPQALIDLLLKPKHHLAEVQGSSFDVSHQRLAEMVAVIDPDIDHDTWVKCGMALHHASGGTAFDVWDQWSNRGTKYPGRGTLSKRWHSFGKSANPVTLATLIHYAEASGWQQPVTCEATEQFKSDGLDQQTEAPQDKNDTWPEPLPLPHGLLPVGELEESMLPLSLGPWVFDIAHRMQCPADFVAVGALTALGSVVGSKVAIRPQRNTDWIEVPNIWGMVIGRPGAMKSPALAEALRPLKKLQSKENKKFKDAMKKYEVTLKAFQLKKKNLEEKLGEQIGKGLPTEGVERELHALDEPRRPPNRRYEVNDCTYEALGEIMSHNPNGTLMHRDELVSLLSDLSREEKASARGFFLQAWNGTSSYIFDRIGRGRVEIENVCLSVLGSTQPAKAAPFFYDANNGGAGDDGLIQRFSLIVWPDHNKAWVPSDEGTNLTAMNDAHRVFQELDALNAADIHSESYSLLEESRIELEFDLDALDRFVQWRTCLERDVRSDTYPPALESHFSKYRKLVPSMALLFYLADGGRAAVDLAALDRAIRLSEHLKSHALRAYSSGSVAIKDAATRILKKVRSKDLVEGFTARSVYCKDWSGLRDPKILGSALDLLAEFGYLKAIHAKSSGGGRPTTTYTIHPKMK